MVPIEAALSAAEEETTVNQSLRSHYFHAIIQSDEVDALREQLKKRVGSGADKRELVRISERVPLVMLGLSDNSALGRASFVTNHGTTEIAVGTTLADDGSLRVTLLLVGEKPYVVFLQRGAGGIKVVPDKNDVPPSAYVEAFKAAESLRHCIDRASWLSPPSLAEIAAQAVQCVLESSGA